MPQVVEEKKLYLSQFAELAKAGREESWLRQIRQDAMERFDRLGFPTNRWEEWKYTNVASLKKIPFRQSARGDAEATGAASVSRHLLEGLPSPRLVFVDGRFDKKHSSLEGLPPGVTVGSLAQFLDADARSDTSNIEPHLSSQLAYYDDHAFAALNSAFFLDGAFVHAPKGTVCELPIYLSFLTTESSEPTVSYPRVLVVAEESSQLTLIEDYASIGGQVYLTNSVSELILGENTTLDHYRLVRESAPSFHISTIGSVQKRSSNLTTQALSFGGGFVRNDVHALLDGEACECTLNGLVVGTERQHIDNHTRIVHARPNCRSWEIYKAILDDEASGVFNGKIYVHPDAQKTDAKQTNQSLVLSDRAVMNSKPELEIYADDVKCTHGATVGQLDTDAIFYLQTRGIDKKTAEGILTYAFSIEVVEQIKIGPLRKAVEDILFEKLPQDKVLGKKR